MGCGASRSSSKVLHSNLHPLDDSYFITSQIDSQLDATLLSVVHRTTGSPKVAKVLSRNSEAFNKDGVATEVEVMKKLRHPHCVSVTECLDEGDVVNVVYPLPAWSDLASFIVTKSRMEETDAAFVTAQLASALHYMHGQGVCHRGLSPHSINVVSDNIMSPNFLMVIIADFGTCTPGAMGYQEVMGAGVDTNPFSAPELIRTSLQGRELYSSKVDVWSLGMLLYTMLCGDNPFYRFPPSVLQDKIMAADVPFKEGPFKKVWGRASQECLSFTQSCLRLNARSRPTAGECKKNEWLKVARRNRAGVGSWGTNASSVRDSSLSSKATRRAGSDAGEPLDLGWGDEESSRRALEKRTNNIMHGGDTPPSRESSARSRQSEGGGAEAVSAKRSLKLPSSSPVEELAAAAGGGGGRGPTIREHMGAKGGASAQREDGVQEEVLTEISPMDPDEFQKLASDGRANCWTADVDSEAEEAGAEFRAPEGDGITLLS